MTGPEHYKEAQRLAAGAQNVMDVAPIDGLTRVECAALAQVHATLALAAAVGTLDAFNIDGQAATGRRVDDGKAWRQAAESGEQYPTQDAYDATVRALEKHRARADRAEALLEKVRDHVGEHGQGEIDVWSLREVLAGREVRI